MSGDGFGIVEGFIRRGHGPERCRAYAVLVRDIESWRPVFAHQERIRAGQLPAINTLVAYTIVPDDRGRLCAANLRVIGPPEKAVEQVCRSCGATFTILGVEVAWYTRHHQPAFELPLKCKPCRKARRAAAYGG